MDMRSWMLAKAWFTLNLPTYLQLAMHSQRTCIVPCSTAADFIRRRLRTAAGRYKGVCYYSTSSGGAGYSGWVVCDIQGRVMPLSTSPIAEHEVKAASAQGVPLSMLKDVDGPAMHVWHTGRTVLAALIDGHHISDST
jgi:hypothetical protein